MEKRVRLQVAVRQLLQRDLLSPRFYVLRARKQGLARALGSFVHTKIPWALPLPRLPFVVSLEPTNVCNLRCIMCPSPTLRAPRGSMDMSLYDRIVRQAADGGVHRFRFVGLGEPTLHPELPEMIRRATRAGIYTEVSTNATLLTEDLGRALLDAGLSEIAFSLDAADPATFERIREGARYREVMDNIDGFLALCAARRERPITVARMVVMEGSDVEAFARAWSGRVDSLQFNQMRPYAKTKLLRLGRTAAPRPVGRPARCRQIVSYMLIGWDGRVGLCNQSSVIVGDARTESLEAIWRGKALTEVRRLHAGYEGRRIDVCRVCPLLAPRGSADERPPDAARVTERVAWSDARVAPRTGPDLPE